VKVLDLTDHVGPNAEVVTNEKGAKQSKVVVRLDLVPVLAEIAVGEILQHGAEKYGEENWRKISDPMEHLNHALIHARLFQAGDQSEGNPVGHLARATCRMLFALELEILRLRAGGKPREPFTWEDEVDGAVVNDTNRRTRGGVRE
jgi:hypothetical protein